MSDNKYKLTVGLEIHAELKTNSKMFCGCKNDPEEKRPNANVCPICMAHPGALPVINKEAVKHVLKAGLAVGGKIADFTEFDRKNYFYPDIPKGYQISQYKFPLVSGGELAGVKITRVHLEEDTATSEHERGDYSLVDFNRAGVPLMELVTEPVISSAEQAGNFARELQLLLRALGASDANMEKGEMRVEANISVAPIMENSESQDSPFFKGSPESARGGILKNSPAENPPTPFKLNPSLSEQALPLKKGDGGIKAEKLGTKVEVKNLNSFRTVERAIAYEMERQSALLEAGDKVEQETRGWDEGKQKTFSQRKKEESHDYRYFPDPDLPKLKLSELADFSEKELRKEMPELPSEKRARYAKDFGLKSGDIETLIRNRALGKMFEEFVAPKLKSKKELLATAANYITNDLVKLMEGREQNLDLVKENFYLLIEMIGAGEISSRGAKDILAEMFASGGAPKSIAEKKNLFQKSGASDLQKVVDEVIKQNSSVVNEYKSGKETSLQFLIGQGMKLSKGSANPAKLKEVFEKTLKGK